mgnify:CR=1 FL=1
MLHYNTSYDWIKLSLFFCLLHLHRTHRQKLSLHMMKMTDEDELCGTINQWKVIVSLVAVVLTWINHCCWTGANEVRMFVGGIYAYMYYLTAGKVSPMTEICDAFACDWHSVYDSVIPVNLYTSAYIHKLLFFSNNTLTSVGASDD